MNILPLTGVAACLSCYFLFVFLNVKLLLYFLLYFVLEMTDLCLM